jgi:hypothetical protein
MTNRATAAALALLCLLAAGCNAPRDAFDQRPLGQQLADVSTSDQVAECSVGWRTGQYDVWLVPMVLHTAEAQGLKDDQGRCVARSLSELNCVHWGLLVTVDRRSVFEIEIPPDRFVEATAEDEKTLFQVAGGQMAMQFLGCLFSLADQPETETPAETPPAANPATRPVRLNEAIEAMRKVHYGMLEEMRETEPGPDGSVSTDATTMAQGLDRLKSALRHGTTGLVETAQTLAEVRYPKCVAEYVCIAASVMDAIPMPAEEEEQRAAVALNTFLGGTMTSPSMVLLMHPEAFRGITRPDFVWVGDDRDLDCRIEVRNMGQRRVRVEVTRSTVRPPW